MVGDKHIFTLHHLPADTQSVNHIGDREAIELDILGLGWALTPREEVSEER